jgi:hypothetical protein
MGGGGGGSGGWKPSSSSFGVVEHKVKVLRVGILVHAWRHAWLCVGAQPRPTAQITRPSRRPEAGRVHPAKKQAWRCPGPPASAPPVLLLYPVMVPGCQVPHKVPGFTLIISYTHSRRPMIAPPPTSSPQLRSQSPRCTCRQRCATWSPSCSTVGQVSQGST